MRGGTETNGFQAKAVGMTHIFEEVPHSSSHKHSHAEAMLHVLEGSGYSEVEGRRYDWAAGNAVHVPPRMTANEHFNKLRAAHPDARVEFGIRFSTRLCGTATRRSRSGRPRSPDEHGARCARAEQLQGDGRRHEQKLSSSNPPGE